MPVEDSMLLFNYGTPKEARYINLIRCQLSMLHVLILYHNVTISREKTVA